MSAPRAFLGPRRIYTAEAREPTSLASRFWQIDFYDGEAAIGGSRLQRPDGAQSGGREHLLEAINPAGLKPSATPRFSPALLSEPRRKRNHSG